MIKAGNGAPDVALAAYTSTPRVDIVDVARDTATTS